jgi:hypothetical protein
MPLPQALLGLRLAERFQREDADMSGIELFAGIMALLSFTSMVAGGKLSRIGSAASAFEEQCEREHGRVVMVQNGAYAAGAEQRKRIQKYVADHPEMEAARRDNLKGYCAAPGMTKEEVRVLMNGPVEEIRTARELAKAVRGVDPGLKNRVDEAWLYETDTYLFAGGVLIGIEKRSARFDS